MLQNIRATRLVAAAALAVTLGACDGAGGDDAIVQKKAALTGTNGLAWNGLAYNGLAYNGMAFNGMTFNGLAYNGLAYNGLAYNGLAYNGLTYNADTTGGLSDPTVNKFVSYLVGCALPEGDSVSYTMDGKTYTFAGSIGLAPEWKTGACGVGCQRWVSACLLARINKLGQHVEISMRGANPALDTVRFEERDFQTREATYYGNLFAGGDQIYTCVSPGATTIERVCGDTLAGCPMNVVGSCADVCAGPGRHGSFRDCSSGSGGDVYTEAITIFLR